MTRAWRDWQANADVIEKLEAEEKRLQLKAKCQRALVLARLYGGSALILGTNDADPTQPLRPDSVKARRPDLRPRAVALAAEPRPAAPRSRRSVVRPARYFEISQPGAARQAAPVARRRLHRPEGSGGRFYPSMSWFWGDPIMQSIGEAVKNADLAQSGFAALIDRAAVDVSQVQGPDEHRRHAGGREADHATASRGRRRASRRIARADRRRRRLGQMQVSWSGIPQIMDSFILVVAGAADIPMTRLLGQSPKGLQSTGDGEERDYQSMIKARQDELLAPALDRIDELLIPSALGSKPSDIYYEFGPLRTENEKDAATIETASD
jgi:hypothetical protein